MQELILASSSVHRARSLERLGLDFRIASPDVDEALREGEAPAQRAERLAHEKARAVRGTHPNCAVIGSDQVAAFGNEILRKPEDDRSAVEQLRAMSGRMLRFHTALCVIDGRSGDEHHGMDVTLACFRTLSRAEIQRYVHRDRPIGCAGAFKVESLGISLFERIDSIDPSALVGLPMIALTGMLRSVGYAVP